MIHGAKKQTAIFVAPLAVWTDFAPVCRWAHTYTMVWVTGFYTLAETEKTIESRLSGLEIDFTSQAAIANLYRAANSVRKYFSNTVLRSNDLSWTGFVVLWVVWIWPGIEVRHAAEEAGISKSTLSGVVRTMEGRSLMRREIDPTDRRLVHLELTDQGDRMMLDLFPRFNGEESFAVSPLSSKGVQELTKSLKAIVTHLEANMPETMGE